MDAPIFSHKTLEVYEFEFTSGKAKVDRSAP